MNTKERSAVIVLAGILLGIMILCFFSISASAGETGFSHRTDSAETAFKAGVKDVLGEFGMRNAGVTMTKVTYDGINVSYSVSIRVSSYTNFNQMEKGKMLERLETLNLEVANSEVVFSFS